MGLPPSPAPPHLYPQALQLKLYQAFIFSIPILFSIILFLLFYLFYLKRRASTLSSPPPILPRTSNQATSYVSSVCQMGLKGEVKDNLPIILFDEELKTRDTQCCVCLGEFEIKEELFQVPSCKHVFHIDCIHHWLHSNSTCPLCRCSIIPTTKLCSLGCLAPSTVSIPLQENDRNSNLDIQHMPLEQNHDQGQQQPEVGASSNTATNFSSEQSTRHVERTELGASLPELPIFLVNERPSSDQDFVVLHIQTHSS